MSKTISNPESVPYSDFTFRLAIDGRIVAVAREALGLSPAPTKQKARKKVPGHQRFGNITLKNVLIENVEFLQWIKSGLSKVSPDAATSALRKNMIIEVCNASLEVVASYRVINGWPMKIDAPELNATGNEVAIGTIELSYEGLELIKSSIF